MTRGLPKRRRYSPLAFMLGLALALGVVSFASITSAEGATNPTPPTVKFYAGKNVAIHVTTPLIGILICVSDASSITINGHKIAGPVGTSCINKEVDVRLGKTVFLIRVTSLASHFSQGTVTVYRTAILARTGLDSMVGFLWTGLAIMSVGLVIGSTRRHSSWDRRRLE